MKVKPVSPRPQPLARSLMLRISAVVLLCLVVLGAFIQFLVLRPAIAALSDGELRSAMNQVDHAMRDHFREVEGLLRTARGWGQAERLKLDDIAGFNALLMPVLTHSRQISSVLFADQDGGEILLLRTATGWHNRITLPADLGRASLLQTRDREGRLVHEERRESSYDTRRRPWFSGALALSDDQQLHWTGAYRFFTTGDPGMTVSTRWSAADGRRRILAFDMTLADLARLTQGLGIGKAGGAAILTADGRVLGAPRLPAFALPVATQGVELPLVAELPASYLGDGQARWSELERPVGESFEFRSGGDDWVGYFRALELGSQALWIGAFARRSDFIPARLSDLALFALLISMVAVAGAMMALRLARRIGEPLHALCDQSERIGRLELERGPPIHAQWTEIERLAQAQEHMRSQLLAAARELSLVQDTTISALASLAETRDGETGRHLRRTQAYVRLLAEALRRHPRFRSELTPRNIELLVKSAPLHDIGKVGVPDRILLKPGRLEGEEMAVMQEHTTLGRDAIEHAEQQIGASVPFLRLAKEVAYSHQEKWDGSGYPQGLRGDQIPVSARLMAVADVYDALISRRIYKSARSHQEALEFIRSASGSHFDPDVVEAFLALEARFRAIALENADLASDDEEQRRHLELVFGHPLPPPPPQAAEQTPQRR